MKSFGKLLMAAVMGSALTFGVNELTDDKGADEKVYRIEHSEVPPVQSARFAPVMTEVPADFTVPAERSMQAVVHITSTITSKNGEGYEDMLSGPFRDLLPELFGQGAPKAQPRKGTGSGVILSDDGYIVTNNHVIAGADDIDVALTDNRTYKAQVIGTDPTTDLAVLKIEEKGLSHLSFGNAEEVKVGEWVLAVGNPFNLTSTVTAGIVSAKGRNIGILREQSSAIESFIQTDAAVNPGNSGGALVNLQGELIGINTAIASRTGSYAGYSFAVPVNIVEKIVEDLMKYGSIQRGYLGVQINSINGDFAKDNDLSVTSGAYVGDFMENSAAKTAGIKVGDVIIEANGVPVSSSATLQETVGTMRPGETAKIKVNRDGREIMFDVVLRNQDGNTDIVKRERNELYSALGAEFKTISPKEASEMEINGGVKIVRLYPGKLRQKEVKEGFVITKIDNEPIKDLKDLTRKLEGRKGGILLEGIYPGQPGEYYYALGM